MTDTMKTALKISNWNVNSDMRQKQPHNKLYFEGLERNDIIQYIKTPGIKCFIEVDAEMLAYIKGLTEELYPDYHFVKGKYCNDDWAFKFIIIIPNDYEIISVYNGAYTTTGEFIENHTRPIGDKNKRDNETYMGLTLGELFEKGFLHVSIQKESTIYNIVLTHLGLRNESKMAQMRMLGNYIECLEGKVIICGDFNTFIFGGNGIYKDLAEYLLNFGFTNLIPFDTPTFSNMYYDIVHVLTDEDREKYFSYVDLAKENPKNAEKIAIEFKTFCEKVSKKKLEPVALDNIYFKNLTLCDYEIKYPNVEELGRSDHVSISAIFT